MSGVRRSRSGCLRCKKASRKCDERKPSCSRCQRLKFPCDYTIRLTWKHESADHRRDDAESCREIPSKRQKKGATKDSVATASPLLEGATSSTELGDIRTPSFSMSSTSLGPLSSPHSGGSISCHDYDATDETIDDGWPVSPKFDSRVVTEGYVGNEPSETRLVPNLPYWKTVIDLDGNDFGILRGFLLAGQRRLHSCTLLDNPIVNDWLPHCPKSATLTKALISFQTSQFGDHGSLSRFQKAVSSYRNELSHSSNLDAHVVSAVGLLLCCTSMHLGYSWTTHLGGLLALAEKFDCGTWPRQERAQSTTMERLAGVDLDAWIIGRHTPPHHIWARKCAGGSGVEPMSGLPRSLLDLIAQASLRQDVSRDLQQWSASLDLRTHGAARYHVWQAYCIGTLLQLHVWEVVDLGDLASLRQSLRAHVETFLEIIPAKTDLNPRMALWPLYMAGTLAEDMETRAFVMDRLAEPSLYRDFRSRNDLGGVLLETWKRRDVAVKATPDVIAKEFGLELGIW